MRIENRMLQEFNFGVNITLEGLSPSSTLFTIFYMEWLQLITIIFCAEGALTLVFLNRKQSAPCPLKNLVFSVRVCFYMIFH